MGMTVNRWLIFCSNGFANNSWRICLLYYGVRQKQLTHFYINTFIMYLFPHYRVSPTWEDWFEVVFFLFYTLGTFTWFGNFGSGKKSGSCVLCPLIEKAKTQKCVDFQNRYFVHSLEPLALRITRKLEPGTEHKGIWNIISVQTSSMYELQIMFGRPIWTYLFEWELDTIWTSKHIVSKINSFIFHPRMILKHVNMTQQRIHEWRNAHNLMTYDVTRHLEPFITL